jgi:hypothetical protein
MGSGPALPGHKLTVTFFGPAVGWEYGFHFETEKEQMVFPVLISKQREQGGKGKIS